jgi:hypothetical protein
MGILQTKKTVFNVNSVILMDASFDGCAVVVDVP